uniref:Uncharacterized protein n=1 Tax=Magallana gigas TaxID=29159 RepID=K1Q100_MAGGI
MGNGGSGTYMHPSDIRFTHDSIESYFSDGYSIPETFRQILWGKITPEDLPLIEIMKYEGQWFVIRGNRRLFLFQQLAKRVKSIIVDYWPVVAILAYMYLVVQSRDRKDSRSVRRMIGRHSHHWMKYLVSALQKPFGNSAET